jgi:AraC-like DNA-binding protein/mannose-6-phosphate isomerase-like protein (cupin superfamily)
MDFRVPCRKNWEPPHSRGGMAITPYLMPGSRAAEQLAADARLAAGRLLERTIAGTARWTTSRLQGRWRRDPNHPVHTNPEWFLGLAGVQVFTCPDGVHRLRAGDTLVIPPGIPHQETADDPSRPLRSLLVLPDAGALHLLEVGLVAGRIRGGRRLRWSHPRASRLQPRLEAWIEAANHTGSAAAEEAAGLARACAALLVDVLACEGPGDPALPLAVRCVQEQIRRRSGEAGLTVAAMAAEAGLHPDWLREVFRRSTGQNPHDALIEHRLEEACRLLRNPRLALRDIVRTVGFRSPSHFTQVFRRRLGTTPGAWRHQRAGSGA